MMIIIFIPILCKNLTRRWYDCMYISEVFSSEKGFFFE